MGYLKDTGLPEYDPAKAKDYAAKYKAETGQDAHVHVSLGRHRP